MFSIKRILVVLTVCGQILLSVSALAGEKSGYLGVVLQDISSSMATALQMDDTVGVLVNEVVKDSPAANAGLEEGDVVLEYDGRTINGNKALVKAVRGTEAGHEVRIKILRGGKTKTLEVVLGERMKNESMMWIGSDSDEHDFHGDKDIQIFMDDLDISFASSHGFLGVEFDDLNEQLGEYFGVEDGNGTLVTKVTEDSAAQKAGLKAGDVIVRFDGKDIVSSDVFRKVMAKTEPEQEISIQVMRKGKTRKFDVTLGESTSGAIKRIEIISQLAHDGMHDSKIFMKHFPHATHEFHRMKVEELHNEEDLEDIKEEMKELRMELKELREILKKN